MRKGLFMRLALSNIRKNRKIYYPYLLTAVITTAMLYIICSLSMNTSFGSETLLIALQLGVIVTALFSIIFLFYTNSFLMKRRKKEFGLFNILGMEKRHIGRVVGIETLVLLVLSLLLGFVLGIALDKLMFMLLSRLLGDVPLPTFDISPVAIVVTLCIIGGTYLLIYLSSMWQIHRSKPIELLKSADVGEREPKARWFFALLGLITLGLGYWLSMTVKDAALSIFAFFIAVLLVIAGTYLLFTTGSIALMKLLKRNKRYYYQTEHFISLSGMMYRMKRNAIGLANICILSTMVLVMVFATVTLWLSADDTADHYVDGSIAVSTHSYDRASDVQAAIASLAEREGLSVLDERHYTSLMFTVFKRGTSYQAQAHSGEMLLTDTVLYVLLMPLEDYNRISGQNAVLAKDEALLSPSGLTHDGDTVDVLGNTYRVKAQVPLAFTNRTIAVSAYPSLIVVVPTMADVEALDVMQREIYGKHASSITWEAVYDLTGTGEQEIAFSDDLRQALRDEGFDTVVVDSHDANRATLMDMFGGLLFVGLFLSVLFIMAMILIMYYKQISEGYDDNERYRIMRNVGLSRAEIRRSINAQIMTVFFLPLLVAGIHIAFAFPCLTVMFSALSVVNVTLMTICALASFALFALLYGAVYLLTAKVYYRIVSE